MSEELEGCPTGFEHPDSPFEERFLVLIGRRCSVEWRDDLQCWDVVDTKYLVLAGWVYCALGLLGSVAAGYLVHFWMGVVALLVFSMPPFMGAFLLFVLASFLLDGLREVEVRADAEGLSVGETRWKWSEIGRVTGGRDALRRRGWGGLVREPGLVFESPGRAVAWPVQPGERDLVGLLETLERLRCERTVAPPDELDAVEQLREAAGPPTSREGHHEPTDRDFPPSG